MTMTHSASGGWEPVEGSGIGSLRKAGSLRAPTLQLSSPTGEGPKMNAWGLNEDVAPLSSVRSSGGGIGSKRFSDAGKPSPRTMLSANPSEADLMSPGVQAYSNAIYDDTEDFTGPAANLSSPPQPRHSPPPHTIPELKEDLTPRQPRIGLQHANSLPAPVAVTPWRSSPSPSPHGSTMPMMRAHSVAVVEEPVREESQPAENEYRVQISRNGRPRPGPLPSFDEGEPIVRTIDWAALQRTTQEQEQQMVAMVRTGDRAKAVDLQAPLDGFIRCSVLRKSGMLNLSRAYELRLEDSDTFLINGTMWHFDGYASPSYTLSLAKKNSQDEKPTQLNCNRAGTEYGLRNPGQAKVHIGMKDAKVKGKTPGEFTKEMTVNVILRLPDADAEQRYTGGRRDRSAEAVEQATLLVKRTVFPDPEDVPAEDLYQGRVPVPSPKNFQLVRLTDAKEVNPTVVLQFCKVNEKRYALDYAHPLTAETAFSCALAYIGRNNSHL